MSDMVNHPPHYTKGGIPWRYDFENMPKDGATDILVWLRVGGLGHVMWGLVSLTWLGANGYKVDESEFTAWCPINPPERQIDREEKK